MLEELSLGGTAITDDGIEALQGCRTLSFLSLSNTAVTDAAMKIVSRLPRLQELWIFNTQVTRAGLLALSESKALETVYLTKETAELLTDEESETLFPKTTLWLVDGTVRKDEQK